MRTAFKEWAVVTDALGRGDQILILRKGGISEGKAGFQVEHPEFALFPSLYHQQRDSVIPSAQARYDEFAPSLPDPSHVVIQHFAKVVEWRKIDSLPTAERLRGQHIWRDDVIAQRFDWGKEKNIFALAVRVFQLHTPLDLPVVPSYAGCKSWIQLETDVPETNLTAVLNDGMFTQRLSAFVTALE